MRKSIKFCKTIGMRRFFILNQAIEGNKAKITGSDVHHIREVLRLDAGARLTLIDESAAEHEAEITSSSDSIVSAKIISTKKPQTPAVYVALFQGLPKGAKFDEIVEKATELGADQITPVMMERTIPRPVETTARLRRWRNKAVAASKQSRRTTITKVDAPLEWPMFLDELHSFDAAVLFWEGASKPADHALHDYRGNRLALIIGPEGGLAAAEVEALTAVGAKPAWLGPRILRTETAPVAALAIVNHILKR